MFRIPSTHLSPPPVPVPIPVPHLSPPPVPVPPIALSPVLVPPVLLPPVRLDPVGDDTTSISLVPVGALYFMEMYSENTKQLRDFTK